MVEVVGVDIRGEDHLSPLIKGLGGEIDSIAAKIDGIGGGGFLAMAETIELSTDKTDRLRGAIDATGDTLALFGDQGAQFRNAIDERIVNPMLRAKAANILLDQQIRQSTGTFAKAKDQLALVELQMDAFLGGAGRTRVAVAALGGAFVASLSTGIGIAIDSIQKFIEADTRAYRASQKLDKAVDRLSEALGSALVGGSKNAGSALDKLTGIVEGLTGVIEENEETIFEWVKSIGEGSVEVVRFVGRVGLGLRTIVAAVSDGFGLLFRAAEVSFLSFKQLAFEAIASMADLWVSAAKLAEAIGKPFSVSSEKMAENVAALRTQIDADTEKIRVLNTMPIMPETEKALALWDKLDNMVDSVLGKVSGAKGGGKGRRRGNGGGGGPGFDMERALNEGLTMGALGGPEGAGEISNLLGHQAVAWKKVGKSMEFVNDNAADMVKIPDAIQMQIDGVLMLRDVWDEAKGKVAEFSGTVGEAMTNVAFGSEKGVDAARRVWGGLLSDIGQGAIAQGAVLSMNPLFGPAYGIPLAAAGGVLVGVGNEIAGRGGGSGGGGTTAAQSIQRTTLPQMERQDDQNRQAVFMFGDRPVRGYMTNRAREDRRLRRV